VVCLGLFGLLRWAGPPKLMQCHSGILAGLSSPGGGRGGLQKDFCVLQEACHVVIGRLPEAFQEGAELGHIVDAAQGLLELLTWDTRMLLISLIRGTDLSSGYDQDNDLLSNQMPRTLPSVWFRNAFSFLGQGAVHCIC